MIEYLTLKNLKCFEELSLDLAPLTVLTGFNAAGKSTSLQTLLLLCQSLRAEEWNRELRLNGPLVSLGTPGDILNPNFNGKGLSLGIGTSGTDLTWNFVVVESESRRALNASSLDVRFSGSDWDGLGPEKLMGLVPKDPEPRVEAAVQELERLVFLVLCAKWRLRSFRFRKTSVKAPVTSAVSANLPLGGFIRKAIAP